MNKEKKSTLDELMTTKEQEEVLADDKRDAITLDEPKRKTWLIVLITIVAVMIMAGAGYVAYQSFLANQELKTEEKIVTPVAEEKVAENTPATPSEKAIYVDAVGGLNLRKEPKSDSEVLAVIPNGTKVTILETNGDWQKTEYDGQTGWIAKLYTSETNPLVYSNATHGFGLTFPDSWSSYTVVKRDDADPGVTAYYDVFLATNETELYTDGKASMFVIGVYTPAQWALVGTESGIKPNVIKETTKYVYSYSLAQATPSDLTALRSDVSGIVETFVEL